MYARSGLCCLRVREQALLNDGASKGEITKPIAESSSPTPLNERVTGTFFGLCRGQRHFEEALSLDSDLRINSRVSGHPQAFIGLEALGALLSDFGVAIEAPKESLAWRGLGVIVRPARHSYIGIRARKPARHQTSTRVYVSRSVSAKAVVWMLLPRHRPFANNGSMKYAHSDFG